MQPTLKVAPTARDIVFHFDGACSCCKSSTVKNDGGDTWVYVNSLGVVELWDMSKVDTVQNANIRSYRHLEEAIQRSIDDTSAKAEEIREKTLKKIPSLKDLPSQRPILKGRDIQRILKTIGGS